MKSSTRILFILSLLLTASIQTFAGTSPFKVVHGPWIQNVTETSFTVLWTTEQKALCWVEVAPDDGTAWEQESRAKYYETCTGRRLTGTFHSITVGGLEKATKYRYRIVGQPIANDENPYATDYLAARVARGVHTIKTLDHSAASCRFSMVNDMHFNDAKYATLMHGMDKAKTDFIVLNGDIVSFSNYQDTLIKHTFDPIREYSADFPVFFARGNHETRGVEFYLLPKAFPTSTGEFYYTFRQGPVAFIVLDAGEDKPDNSPEYSGQAAFDEYRLQELEWMKKAMKDPDFANAPKKVCIMHVPVLDEPDAWYSQHWIAQNFTTVLNEAGIDMMISGHHHKYIVGQPGKYGNNFPIIVNSNNERLDFSATASRITIKTYNESGALVHSLEY